MTSLEPKQKAQLEAWIDEVREHEHSALKWAALLYKIKESGYWQTVAKSWPDFCHDVFGYSRDKAYRYVACGEALQDNTEEFTKDPPKSIRQVKLRSVARLQHTNLEYVGTETAKENKLMPARLIPDAPIEHVTPPPHPVEIAVVTSPRAFSVPPIVAQRIDEIVREACRLGYSDPKFRHMVDGLLKLQRMVQAEPPGMETVAVNRSRGTEQEIADFLASLKEPLPRDDAEWFFCKCEGCGWKNDGKAIVDWKMTCRAWAKARIFPSQKVQPHRNGSPDKPKHWAAKELDRDLETLRREK